MTNILTITANPALDVSTETDAVRPDLKLRCAPPRVQPGGGGVNVSRAIAHLGGTSRALVAVGGETGERLMRGLGQVGGVTARAVEIAPETRSSLSVIDTGSGQQYRFVMPGPDWGAAEGATLREAALAAIAPGDLVVPSGSYPPGLPAGFFCEMARDLPAGARMILDTSGEALRRAADSRGLFALRMDHDEAQDLSGHPCAELTQIAALAQKLRARGVAENVLIAAGAQGTVIACEGGCWLTRPPVVRVLSKVGAGDSFVAGFTLAIARGESPLEACRQGTAAAASAVTTPDTDLCNQEDAARFAEAVSVSSFTEG